VKTSTTVTTRWHRAGDVLIESVKMVTVEHSVLPAQGGDAPSQGAVTGSPAGQDIVAPTEEVIQPSQDVPQAPETITPEPLILQAPAATSRGKAAFVRGLWTFLFSLLGMAGAALMYIEASLDKLPIPGWAAVPAGAAVAAGLYATKKFVKPDGTW
jgi:hypothetical protein